MRPRTVPTREECRNTVNTLAQEVEACRRRVQAAPGDLALRTRLRQLERRLRWYQCRATGQRTVEHPNRHTVSLNRPGGMRKRPPVSDEPLPELAETAR